mmetsp:Transcript_21632/g.45732  ORF Transcript_21632/g.45732 Transcript_21632/m.45732 type:complete len:413 (+) Transcript_21632:105-1343(+)
MITQTPPRESAAVAARKRNRHDANSITSSLALPSAHQAPLSTGKPYLFHQGHSNIMRPSPLFSPYCQKNNPDSISSTAVEAGPGAAAAVSPYVHAMTMANHHNSNILVSPLFKLETVQEEGDATTIDTENLIFSQTSIASSLTFGSNIGASSPISMDYSSDLHSDVDESNTAAIGNMVGVSIGGAVGPRVQSAPHFFPADGYVNAADCLPPTKRARTDYTPQGMSPMMDLSVVESPRKRMGVNCINFKLKIDKPDGKLCCHVCSLEETSNSSKHQSNNNASLCHYQGHASNAPMPSTPRSRSLLTYFQPTKRQATSSALHPHQKSQASMNNSHGIAQSNLSPCRYCDKPTCATCTRQCERCQHRFCTFCTKIDYESSVAEQIMCFECDEYVRNRSGMIGGSKGDGDCDMMDF